MRNKFPISDALKFIAPAGMCGECIGDRLPVSDRRLAHALIDDLQPPQFKRVTGVHCLSSGQTVDPTRLKAVAGKWLAR
jgi:hypothetical protein